ncbi:RES family NAD+ phosphorylase [Pseudoroseicyclus sp. H15]
MIRLEAPVWRILFADQTDPLAPVRGPKGRFHHSGQPALYASLSPEGAAAALARYVRPDDPPRLIHRLDLSIDGIVDLRENDTARIAWHEIDGPAPTWPLSDAARASGAHGLLYRSRTRPDLENVALFDWAGALRIAGVPNVWPDPSA